MRKPKKAYILLMLFFLSILVSSYSTWGRLGLIWGFLISLSLHWLLFFYGDYKLLHLFKIQALEGQDSWGLSAQLAKLCKKAHIPPPKIYISPSQHPNVYSLARSYKSSSIIISRGLVDTLSSDEREAILAFQVAQIRSLQTINLSLSSLLMSLLWFPFWLRSDGNKVSSLYLTLLKLWNIVIWPLAFLIRILTVRGKNYLETDQQAIEWIKSSDSLARALVKLDSYTKTQNFSVLPSTSHLFIVSPLTHRRWDRYFQAQPDVELRVKNLTGHFPI